MPTTRKLTAPVAVLAAALVLALAVPAPAGAIPPDGTFLTLAWQTNVLYAVDPTTGATTPVGTGGLRSSTGIAWDATTDTLFGVDYDTAPASLYTIDPDTGATTVIGSTGISNPTGLDVQPGTGALFTVYDNGEGSILATVNTSTGVVNDIDSVVAGDLEVRIAALAFHPTDGTLYGLGYDDSLYEIDPDSGGATMLFESVPDAYGLAFDCGGQLFASDADHLFSIDLGDGTATSIGPMPFDPSDFVENLTVVCSGAEPVPTTTTSTTAAVPSTTTSAPASTTVTTGTPSTTAARAVTASPRYTG